MPDPPVHVIYKLLKTSESLQVLCPQSSSDNKRETHLADALGMFMSDLNILCTVAFPQPVISDRSRTVCLLLLLTAASTFIALPVFLNGDLPIRSAAGFPSRNLENLFTKACDAFR